MMEILQGAGFFAYVLGVCSLIGFFIICERLYALRKAAILPDDLVSAILENKPFSGGRFSVLARILEFERAHPADEEAVKAYARLEINRMERGFVFLEVIVAAAPFIGLMGTVLALIQVFGATEVAAGSADRGTLMKGISLALSTTFLGLCVAIPALFFSSLLQRKVETHAVNLESLLERVLHRNERAGLRERVSSPSSS